MSRFFRLSFIRTAAAAHAMRGCVIPGAARLTAAELAGDRRAVTVLEYALIAAFTAMLIITGTTLFGGNAVLAYGKISDALDQGAPGSVPMTAGAGAAPSAPATPAGPASAAPCLVGKDDCSGDQPRRDLSGRMNGVY